MVYEYKGSFYVTEVGKTPAYDENGVPTDERIEEFDEVFKEAIENATNTTVVTDDGADNGDEQKNIEE